MAKFEKKAFSPYILILYIKQIDSVLPCVCSVIRELTQQDDSKTQNGRMTKKCGARVHSQSYAASCRHSAVLSVPVVLLRKLPMDHRGRQNGVRTSYHSTIYNLYALHNTVPFKFIRFLCPLHRRSVNGPVTSSVDSLSTYQHCITFEQEITKNFTKTKTNWIFFLEFPFETKSTLNL